MHPRGESFLMPEVLFPMIESVTNDQGAENWMGCSTSGVIKEIEVLVVPISQSRREQARSFHGSLEVASALLALNCWTSARKLPQSSSETLSGSNSASAGGPPQSFRLLLGISLSALLSWEKRKLLPLTGKKYHSVKQSKTAHYSKNLSFKTPSMQIRGFNVVPSDW